MAISTVQYTDVTKMLAELLADVNELRTYWFVSDATRPPAAVLGLPALDFEDPDAGFCFASYEVPIMIVTARANDRDAQEDLSRLLRDVVIALRATPPHGVFSIDPLDARPTTAVVSGQELPAYQIRVRVRA